MIRWVDTLSYARRIAIAIGADIVWCPLAAPHDTAPADCGDRDGWHRGSQIFVDRNNNRRRDPDEAVLRHLGPEPPPARWYWRSFQNRSDLTMNADGATDWQNGSFLYCPAGNDARHARLIVLNAAGRVRLAADRDGDGVPERSNREPITCPSI